MAFLLSLNRVHLTSVYLRTMDHFGIHKADSKKMFHKQITHLRRTDKIYNFSTSHTYNSHIHSGQNILFKKCFKKEFLLFMNGNFMFPINYFKHLEQTHFGNVLSQFKGQNTLSCPQLLDDFPFLSSDSTEVTVKTVAGIKYICEEWKIVLYNQSILLSAQ